jgi:hypothetical protein
VLGDRIRAVEPDVLAPRTAQAAAQSDDRVLWCLSACIRRVMSTSTHWDLIVTDHALRRLLGSQRRDRKGAPVALRRDGCPGPDMGLRSKRAKARNATVQSDQIEQAIDEALGWTRRA